MTYAHCGTENGADRKFCNECGAQLTRDCPSCGAAVTPGHKFCGECGATLEADARGTVGASLGRAAPTSERRLVSVLFADRLDELAASPRVGSR